MLEGVQIDPRGFFREGSPYVPVISPRPREGEVCAIRLDLTLDSELKWEGIAKGEGPLFWQLDFGLDRATFPWNSGAALSALCKAAAFFRDGYLAQYKARTLGVCLYQGPLTADGVEVVAGYLQQLAALFPDELPLFACFDIEQPVGPTQLAQMIAPDSFPYLHIGLATSCYPLGVLRRRGEDWVAFPLHNRSLGVVLPLAKSLASAMMRREIDHLIDQLQNKGTPYRLLYESHLSEQWDELDALVLFSAALSDQGKRKARGFVAAGGTLVVAGPSLGFPGEMAFKTYLEQQFPPS